MKHHLIAPSILSANFNHLASEVEMLNKSEADWIHVDVMDGVFVPNISFGFPILEHIKNIAKKPLDVHLMIINPDNYIERFVEAGADILTVHVETCTHLNRTIQRIKKAGAKASVCLNPHTPVHLLDEIIAELDMVLIMSVNPGFGGQGFIESSYEKVMKLKELILLKNAECMIEVDGGINFNTGSAMVEAGADVLVAGNFVFSNNDPMETIRKLKHEITGL